MIYVTSFNKDQIKIEFGSKSLREEFMKSY